MIIITTKKILFLLIVILSLLLLGGLAIYIVFSLPIKITVPEEPSNVPESANWYGGPDGGVWIDINQYNDKDNFFYSTMYFDSTGEIWSKGLFKYDYKDNITLDELKEKINGYYGGDIIILNEIGSDGKYKVLKKIDNK
jgi:hypothetical protein